MKALLAAVAAAALLAPLAAVAQDRGGRDFNRGGERSAARSQDSAPQGDRGRGRGRNREFGAERQAPTQAVPAAPRAPRAERAPQAQSAPRFSGERQRGQAVQDRRGDRGGQSDRAPRQARAAPNFDRRGQDFRNDNRGRADNRFDNRRGDDTRRFDNRRPADNRFGAGRNEWRSDRRFADNRSAFRRVRAAPFRWPSGYRATRWSISQRLPSIFLTRSYFIGDFFNMGLPYPPPGTDWVRVGADALLVDTYTGEILDVVYDAFYW